jgi:hypothetical protein
MKVLLIQIDVTGRDEDFAEDLKQDIDGIVTDYYQCEIINMEVKEINEEEFSENSDLH